MWRLRQLHTSGETPVFAKQVYATLLFIVTPLVSNLRHLLLLRYVAIPSIVQTKNRHYKLFNYCCVNYFTLFVDASYYL